MATEANDMLDWSGLLEGEAVVAEVVGRWLDENGDEGGAVILAVTSTRIGIWDESHDVSWVSLSALQSFFQEEDRLRLLLAGAIHALKVPEAEKLSTFSDALLVGRRTVLSDDVCPAFLRVRAELERGDRVAALAALDEVVEGENYHPGPRLLRYSLLRSLGRAIEGVDALVDATAVGLTVLPLATAVVVVNAALNPAQAYRAALLASAGLPFDQLAPGRLLVAFRYAAGRGAFDEAADVLVLAGRQLAPAPQVSIEILFGLSALLPRTHWPRMAVLMEELASEFAQARSEEGFATDTRSLQREWNIALDVEADAPTRTRAFIACITLLGGTLESCMEQHRILGQWDLRLQQPDAALLSEERWSDAAWDPETFDELVCTSDSVLGANADVEGLWALLRAGALEADDKVAEYAMTLLEEMLDGRHGAEPNVWVAALLAAEIFLMLGLGDDAAELVEGSYKKLRGEFSVSADPYHEQARALTSLYAALGRRDGPRVRLYMDLLSTESALSWVRGLVLKVFPEALQPVAPPQETLSKEVANFQHWLAYWRNAFTDARMQDVALKIDAAQRREHVTIVVGGETSAGKSSFINRLLGADLLFATQEEATAVPTHLRWGPSWSVRVYGEGDRLRDQLVTSPDARPEPGAMERFIQRYTFLSSGESAGTKRVVIEAPIPSLSPGMEFVDTPGLNAHASRTAIAEAVIDDAHVCIFVIDARNALKGGEMRKIQWATSAVGKTIFVLNKMDLVLGDDDLDCDANAPSDLLVRVRHDLVTALGSDVVHVHAVSSVRPPHVTSGAEPYVAAIGDVRERLRELLVHSRERLVAYTAAKAARLASQMAVGTALEQVATHEIEVSRLLRQVPGDPEVFRGEVLALVASTWQAAVAEYVAVMVSALQSILDSAGEKVVTALQACNDHDDVKRLVDRKVPAIFREYLQAIDACRAEQWNRIGRVVLDDVAGLFSFLYEGLPFDVQFDATKLLAVATPLPISRSESLKGTVAGMIDNANLKGVGGMAAGAVLGSMILPGVGTVIGGFLGSLFGNSLNEDLLQRVGQAILERLDELHSGAVEALDADITATEDAPSPMMANLLANVEAERVRFAEMVATRMANTEQQLRAAEESAEFYRTAALEASEWARSFDAMMAART